MRGTNNLSSQRLHENDLLLGKAFRDRQHNFVATVAADQGQSDASVAGGGFEDGGARLQEAVFFGALNHSQGSAVLNAAARVQILELGIDASGVCRNNLAQVEDGSLTDQFGDLLRHPKRGHFSRFHGHPDVDGVD